MSKYRGNLTQLVVSDCGLFLTDGGLETTLIFHEGHKLEYFAAFDLLRSAWGKQTLTKYFSDYAQLAQKYQVGFVLESATWRASNDWGAKLGYSSEDIQQFNHLAIALLEDIRRTHELLDHAPMLISGCIGPRGDGYNPNELMSEIESEAYHSEQVGTFARSNADLVSAMTLTYVEEAIGISLAAQQANIPVVISFTVETDGKLPSGQSLGEAISQVDQATQAVPLYYGINCAHPLHFKDILLQGEKWLERIQAIRANASIKSHQELDEAEELDDGNPLELGGQYQVLKSLLPSLNIFGGCCGTDLRHLEEIAKTVLNLSL